MSQKSLRQWSQRSRMERFTDTLQRLELELQMNTARRHLDPLLWLAEELLGGITATADGFVARGREELARMRARVERRGLAIANDVIN
jgi:hypothetical protein